MGSWWALRKTCLFHSSGHVKLTYQVEIINLRLLDDYNLDNFVINLSIISIKYSDKIQYIYKR